MLPLLLLGSAVLITTLLTELAARRGWLPYWVARKVLHFVAVTACALAVLYLDRELLTWIVLVAEVGLVGLIVGNRLMREESGRRAWGIVWFPLAFLLLLLTVADDHVIAFAMLVLAVCDPAATVAGKLLAEDTYQLTGDPKSLEGNAGFLAAFLVLVALHWPFGFDLGVGTLLLIGLVLTGSEALGSRGLDNLLVPLLTALLYARLRYVPSYYLVAIVAAAVPFCWWMVRRGSLTAGGAGAASLLGLVVVVGTGSPWWLLPLVVFLGSSSLIGKLLPVRSAAGDAKQGRARDATQVLANGAVYAVAAFALSVPIVDPEDFAVSLVPNGPVLLVAMAVATADTWSSEIGQYFGGRTYDVLGRRAVPPGLSGGVSVAGTLAGLGGALLIALLGILPVLGGGYGWSLIGDGPGVGAITTAGFLGMLLDSVLGALLQAKYRDPATGQLTDRPAPDRPLVSGLRWMTNDLVNFLAILLTVVVFYLLF